MRRQLWQNDVHSSDTRSAGIGHESTNGMYEV